MKLEAVDKRNPMLIRVATISDTEDHRVKVNTLHQFYATHTYFVLSFNISGNDIVIYYVFCT